MGIKHYWMYTQKRYASCIKKMAKDVTLDHIGVSVDNMIIDMNGIFHSSAQKIFQYGNHKPRTRFLGRTRQSRYPRQLRGIRAQIALFENVCETVETIFRVVRPSRRLILCVDGVAPISKQQQQRGRRFRSAKEQEDDAPFNSNAITPGTKFMDYLTKYIDWYIRRRINESHEWRNIQVIFSNEKAPGEGEHKGISFIRYYGKPSESYCIHGMDADLIMLALSTHMPKFYILRDDVYDAGNEYFCVNIGKMRGEMLQDLYWTEEHHTFCPINAINDFVFLCFMVGNDFLPHIPSIEIIENGIELILEVYKQTCTQYGHITEIRSGEQIRFSKLPLSIFLGIVGAHEKENFEHKMNHKSSFFPDKLLNKHSRQRDDGKWMVNITAYNDEYMRTCFSSEFTEEQLCHQYLEGMQWVLSYYSRGVPNWKWMYKHHYAPPASILARHVDSFKFPRYGRTTPSTPFQQLMCVLPPKSAYLIPTPLNELLTNPDSPLKQFYPDDFEIDLSGKRREWEGIVLLPIVDFELVRKHYMANLRHVDSRELKRNIQGSAFVYTYDAENEYEFRSYYGNIKNCRVKTVMVEL